MINTEFFKPGNFFTLSIIVILWLVIHEKVIKPRIVK